MDDVLSCCQNPPDPINRVPGNWVYQSAQIEATKIAAAQSTDIEIQTTDGDKVTLSSDITLEAAAVTYQEVSRTSASYSESQGQIISASANRSFELTVEGHLDEQEKKEVKEVLTNLFKMIKDFIAGNGDTEQTQSFTNLGAISEVKAHVDMSARLTTAAQAAAQYVSEIPLHARAVIQQAQTSQQPAVSDRLKKLTDRMIEVVKDSGVEPSKILNGLNRQISMLAGPFRNAEPAVWHGAQLRRRILENFADKLQKWMVGNEAETRLKIPADAEKPITSDHSANIKTSAAVSQTILNTVRQDIHWTFEYALPDQHQS